MLVCVFINNVTAKSREPARPLEVSSSAAASGHRSPCTCHSSAGTTACPDTGPSRGSLGSTRATGLPGIWRSEQLRSRAQGTQHPEAPRRPESEQPAVVAAGGLCALALTLSTAHTVLPRNLATEMHVRVLTHTHSLKCRRDASA